MSKTISIANQKGGVGKTTTCVNLAAALYRKGQRVLVIDADPQGNCTTGFGIKKDTLPNVYSLLIGQAEINDCIVHTDYGDVIPSNMDLSAVSVELVDIPEKEFILKKALETIKENYDFIFIDCPPSLELLSIIAFTASDTILIPMQCEYYAMEGIADLTTTIKLCNKKLNPDLKLEGILLTMYDPRKNLSQQVAWEIKKYFEGLMYTNNIPRSIKLAEAPSFGKPGIAYDKWNKGCRAYTRLADEFLEKQKEIEEEDL